MNKKEACELWIQRDFSMIPTALLEKAYSDHEQFCEDITILAPTDEPDIALLPAWGKVFSPNDSFNADWIRRNASDIAELGITVYETDEIGVYLGIDGAGYNFYEEHWIPLYDLRGLRWHEQEAQP